MPKSTYLMSYTAAGLMFNESLKIAAIYNEERDWEKTRAVVTEGNLLQKRVSSSQTRQLRELIKRLRCLSDSQLSLLFVACERDQRYILWLANCKCYRFLFDFAREVMYEKYLSMSYQLDLSDTRLFYDSKALADDSLRAYASTTQVKLQTNLLLIMRQVEILDQYNCILPMLISSDLNNCLLEEDAEYRFIFPARVN